MNGSRVLTRRKAGQLLAGTLLTGSFCSLSATCGQAAAGDARGAIARTGLLASAIERCAKELLLVALDIAPDQYLEALELSRSQLDQFLQRQLTEAAPQRNALATLWPAYDDILLRALETRRASPNLVAAMAEIRPPLSEAAAAWFESTAREGLQDPRSASLMRAYRALLVLHRSCQKIAGDFLMAAFGGARLVAPADLADAASVLEIGLQGLIHGDPQQRLVPAPTAKIREQLQAAESSWADCRRELAATAWGSQLRKSALADFALANTRLSQALDSTLGLYGSL